VISESIDLCPFCQTRGKLKKTVTKPWNAAQQSFDFDDFESRGEDKKTDPESMTAAPIGERAPRLK
jgi:hypothetical protein